MASEFKIDIVSNSLYFAGDINPISAHEFITKLRELEDGIKDKATKESSLYLYSEGGDVPSGLRMYEALKRFNGKITCYPGGFVASSGVTVMCGASKVISTPLTYFLIHQVSGYISGKFHHNTSTLDWHAKCQKNTEDIYFARTNGKVTPEMLKNEVFLTAEQAKELGFVDEIVSY